MRILFIDRSTKLESVDDLQTRARGGMVTSLFKVSDYLSHNGNDVYVISDIKEGGKTRSGVKWINGTEDFPTDCDFLVCNRGVGSGYSDIKARHRILWTHDLPHAGFIPEPKTIKAFSATVFMSRYAERVWRDFYRDIGRSFLIPNGVDKGIFFPRQKDFNYLIFASAPNRGLSRLPFLFDCIESRIKRPIRMKAFSNLKKLHPGEVGSEDGFSAVYNQITESRVELCDPVPQRQLSEELGRAGLMIMPTDYPEICSNIILQSLACGTPVVTTGQLGSSCEWIKDGWNGSLTKWTPADYMVYQVDLIRWAVKILENESLHHRMMNNAAKTKIHTWDQIGDLWNTMLSRLG